MKSSEVVAKIHEKHYKSVDYMIYNLQPTTKGAKIFNINKV